MNHEMNWSNELPEPNHLANHIDESVTRECNNRELRELLEPSIRFSKLAVFHGCITLSCTHELYQLETSNGNSYGDFLLLTNVNEWVTKKCSEFVVFQRNIPD